MRADQPLFLGSRKLSTCYEMLVNSEALQLLIRLEDFRTIPREKSLYARLEQLPGMPDAEVLGVESVEYSRGPEFDSTIFFAISAEHDTTETHQKIMEIVIDQLQIALGMEMPDAT